MEKIQLSEIRNLHEYELDRAGFRREVIGLKRWRRVAVGPLVGLVFENRRTALFQIQEMLRAERIVDPSRVQEEIDVYNTLIPDAGEVSATLFIEVTEESKVKPVLDSFIGLDAGRSLWLETGGEKFFAKFESGHGREDKISAVHYIRIPLGARGLRSLEEGSPARIVLRHGQHRAEAAITPETAAQLVEDLHGV